MPKISRTVASGRHSVSRYIQEDMGSAFHSDLGAVRDLTALAIAAGVSSKPKSATLEIVESLAVARQFELARDQTGVLQLLQVQMQQGAADADLARQLADIVAPVRLQRRHDPQPVRTGERREGGKQSISADGQ